MVVVITATALKYYREHSLFLNGPINMHLHLEQLIAIISLEHNLDCEISSEQPEYFEAHEHKTQYHIELDNGVSVIVIRDEQNILVYGEDQNPIAILEFSDIDLAVEELEIYAETVINE
jgi:hypothetical protein